MSIVGAAPTKALAIPKSLVSAIPPYPHILGQLLSDAQHYKQDSLDNFDYNSNPLMVAVRVFIYKTLKSAEIGFEPISYPLKGHVITV